MENQQNNQRKGLGHWLSHSVTAKLIFIGFLLIILLIPQVWVSGLIGERQRMQKETVSEITRNWGAGQEFSGPVLVVPYTYYEKHKAGEKEMLNEVSTNLYLLPEMLEVTGEVHPEVRYRSIYEAVVYHSNLKVKGRFGEIELKKSGIIAENLQWERARVILGISDLKGLRNTPEFILDGEKYPLEMDAYNTSLFANNLMAIPDFSKLTSGKHEFFLELDLRGSDVIRIKPLGKANTVSLRGDWSDPKFEGDYLPEKREVTTSGFEASWSVPYFDRHISQQWLDKNTKLKNSIELDLNQNEPGFLGVKFLLPVDNYQKTTRTVKYALLVISLTFVSLFFTEILARRRIHPIQYMLIGAAMTIYYTLLLSLSEYLGFPAAYGIASVSTILLIAAFVKAILKSSRTAILFSAILSAFYLFIFVIMQLQTLSLLIGSIGLFVIIAMLMYFSSKVNWERN